MPISRDSISTPLESGTSLLTAQQLPTRLRKALEYVSDRLVRKQLHLTLIVIQNETQALPSPSSLTDSFLTGQIRSPLLNGEVSPALSTCSTSSSSSTTSTKSLSRTRWPSLPANPKAFKHLLPPSPPASPLPATPTCVSPSTPNPYNISLLHASTLTPRASRILQETISKASKKFHIGSGWLQTQASTAFESAANTCELTKRSLHQNDIVFTSEGLTLLSLDHVYQFKSSLSDYSGLLNNKDELATSIALQEATDALQRLVLSQSGNPISKTYLLQAYDYLPVTQSSIVTVNRNYQRCYGGPNLISGIATGDQQDLSPSPQQRSFRLRDVPRKRREAAGALNTKLSLNTTLRNSSVGPATPNTFEDLTPVTRGEWCFLMVGDGWKEGRRAEVVTC